MDVKNILILFASALCICLYLLIFNKKVIKHKMANLLLICGIIFITIFTIYTRSFIVTSAQSFDSAVYNHISKSITDSKTNFMLLITEFGLQDIVSIILAITIAYIMMSKKGNIFWQMTILNFSLAVYTNQTLKTVFARPRPEILRLETVGGFSFPSGHAMISMCFYGFLIYLIIRLFKTKLKYIPATLIGLFVLLIGYSRVYLGSHYASDVLGGFICGLGVLLIACAITEYLIDRKFEFKFNSLILILGFFTCMQNIHSIKLYFVTLCIAILIQIASFAVITILIRTTKISVILEEIKNKVSKLVLDILKFIPIVRLFITYINKGKDVKIIQFLKDNITLAFIYTFILILLSGKLSNINLYLSTRLLPLLIIISIPIEIFYFKYVRNIKLKNNESVAN